MKAVCLKVYVHELDKHHGMALYEWLLEKGNKLGAQGGAAFRALGGFGRHGKMQSEHFFELGSNVPVECSFVFEQKKLEDFLQMLKEEELDLVYMVYDVEIGSSKI